MINDGGTAFRHAVVISFWLSVHLEKLEFVRLLFDMDEMVQRIINNVVRQYKRMMAGATAGFSAQQSSHSSRPLFANAQSNAASRPEKVTREEKDLGEVVEYRLQKSSGPTLRESSKPISLSPPLNEKEQLNTVAPDQLPIEDDTLSLE